MDLNVAWAAWAVTSMSQYGPSKRARETMQTICREENKGDWVEEGDGRVRVQSGCLSST